MGGCGLAICGLLYLQTATSYFRERTQVLESENLFWKNYKSYDLGKKTQIPLSLPATYTEY